MSVDMLPSLVGELAWVVGAAPMEPAEAPPNLSMALAVEDFAPTLLAFVGYWLLSPSALGRIGALLMGLGGAAKSTWKVLIVGWGIEVPVLELALFPLLALGGLLLATTMHKALDWWRWPLVAAGLGIAALSVATRSIEPAFIAGTTVVVWISILGSIYAWRHGNALAAGLFPVSLLAVLALIPLRGHSASDSLAFQWVQQGMNTMAQAIFCVAGYLTYRAVRGKGSDFATAQNEGGAYRQPAHARRF